MAPAVHVKTRRYACGACGYIETWVEDLAALREARAINDWRSYWSYIRRSFDWRRRRRLKLGLCVGCGYDLRGSTARCPECGEPMPTTMADPGADSAAR